MRNIEYAAGNVQAASGVVDNGRQEEQELGKGNANWHLSYLGKGSLNKSPNLLVHQQGVFPQEGYEVDLYLLYM
jgi:hypothetical protein